MKLAASELLPYLFDRIAGEFMRREFQKAQRHALALSLVDGLASAALASIRDAPLERHDRAHAKTPEAELSLNTADRFTTGHSPRDELVQEMAKRSQIPERLARVALFLMETRTDVLLSSGVLPGLHLNELGRISLPSDSPDEQRWHLEALPRLIQPPTFASPSLLDRWLRRPSPSARSLVESLELAELIRPATVYEIHLDSTWVAFEKSDALEWKEAPPLEWKSPFQETVPSG